jgi:hypothetical protein
LIDRKDAAGQTEVAKIYFKSTCYYDGGHRYWEDTIQDQLIDTYFPQFQTEGLVALLSTDQMDFLSRSGDNMESFFLPAFKGASTASKEVVAKLEKVFSKYLDYIAKYAPAQEITIFITPLKSYFSPTLTKSVAKIEEVSKRRGDALVKLQSKTPANIQEVLMGLGTELNEQDYHEISSDISSALGYVRTNGTSKKSTGISFSALENYLTFYTGLLLKEDKPYRFEATALISVLLHEDFVKGEKLLLEASQKYFQKFPDQFSKKNQSGWDYIFFDALQTVFKEVQADCEDQAFVKLLKLCMKITGKSKNMVITTNISPMIKDIIVDEKPTSVIYKNAVKLLTSKKVTLGEDLEIYFYNVKEYTKFMRLVPYLAQKKQEEFYGNYIGELIQGEKWKLLTEAFKACSKKVGSTYVPSKQIANALADTVGQAIGYTNNQTAFAKNIFVCLQTLKMDQIYNERIMAQVLGVAVNDQNHKLAKQIIALLPKKITWNILSYNLACYYARIKDKENLYKTAKLCIELGKSAQQFLDDSDFDDYTEDEKFLEAIGNEKKEAASDYKVFEKPFVIITKTKKNNSEIKKKFKKSK